MASHTTEAAGLEVNQTAQAADCEPRHRPGGRLFTFEFQFCLRFTNMLSGERMPREGSPSDGFVNWQLLHFYP